MTVKLTKIQGWSWDSVMLWHISNRNPTFWFNNRIQTNHFNNQIIKFIFKTVSFKKIKKSFNDETLIQTVVESTVRNWTTTLSTRFESVSSQRDTIPYKLELLRTNFTGVVMHHAVWLIRSVVTSQVIVLSEIMNLPKQFEQKRFFQRTIKSRQKVFWYLNDNTI